MPGGGPLWTPLSDVERKLDVLIMELRGLRSDLKLGSKGPMGRPIDPNNPPVPARRKSVEPGVELEIESTPRQKGNDTPNGRSTPPLEPQPAQKK